MDLSFFKRIPPTHSDENLNIYKPPTREEANIQSPRPPDIDGNDELIPKYNNYEEPPVISITLFLIFVIFFTLSKSDTVNQLIHEKMGF